MRGKNRWHLVNIAGQRMSVIWFNGALYPDDVPIFTAQERGLLFADGAFRTLRVEAGRACNVSAHIARLLQDIEKLNIEPPFSENQIAQAIKETISANQRAGYFPDFARLRLTITRGEGAMPAPPIPQAISSLLITLNAATATKKTQRAIIATQPRTVAPPLSSVKSLAYGENVQALQEAAQMGADCALLLTPKQHVSEAATASIFVLCGKRLLTPPLQDGALRGITRDWLLANAQRFGFKAEEKSMRVQDLMRADLVFTANALHGLCPIAELQGRALKVQMQKLEAMQKAWQELNA